MTTLPMFDGREDITEIFRQHAEPEVRDKLDRITPRATEVMVFGIRLDREHEANNGNYGINLKHAEWYFMANGFDADSPMQYSTYINVGFLRQTRIGSLKSGVDTVYQGARPSLLRAGRSLPEVDPYYDPETYLVGHFRRQRTTMLVHGAGATPNRPRVLEFETLKAFNLI